MTRPANPAKLEIHREKERVRAKRNYDRNPGYYWENQIQRLYGMTAEQYKAMYDAQEGKCAICGREGTMRRGLQIDHCHATGRIRGLLCILCNTAIGKFNDDPALLERAMAYLRG